MAYILTLENAVRYMKNDDCGAYNAICVKYFSGSSNVFESCFKTERFPSPTADSVRNFIIEKGLAVSSIYLEMNIGDGHREISLT